MKLTKNEKSLLNEIVQNPKISNMELSEKLKITTQGIGKLKRSLEYKGVIDRYEVILDYKKLGINCFALTLVKVMPKVFRKHEKQLDEIFSHPNIITLINIPQTNITNIVLFGFRDISEYSNFFRLLQSRLPGIVEIKDSYVFSHESFIKNSASDLFLKIIKQFGEEKVPVTKPPEINHD